jgi:hypothetical protein
MTPLLALESNTGYVAGAYLVFLLLLLIYVAIMAAKLSRIQREVGSIAELADRSQGRGTDRQVGTVRDRDDEIEAVRQGGRG